MKKFTAFLSSKTFFANVILGILFIITAFVGLNMWLDATTHHNESVVIPDISGYSLEEAQQLLVDNLLNSEVIDSAEFNPDLPLGSVVAQYPLAGKEVKIDRIIMLTINPFVVRKIELPSIIEKTLRRAVYDLESKGFVVGELTYVPDIAKDAILKIVIDGEQKKPGDKYIKGTVVDLVVGAGLSNERVSIPYLKFLTLADAENKIKSNSLNLGLALFDDEVTDSTTAQVYKQSPSASLKPKLKMGSFIDIWLTNDSTKIINDSLEFRYPNMNIDSIQNYLDTDTTDL